MHDGDGIGDGDDIDDDNDGILVNARGWVILYCKVASGSNPLDAS